MSIPINRDSHQRILDVAQQVHALLTKLEQIDEARAAVAIAQAMVEFDCLRAHEK